MLERSSAPPDARTPSMTDRSEGISGVVDRPARVWKPLQVRLSVRTYTWLWRFALLQHKFPSEILEQALRMWFRKELQTWPREFVADLPPLGRYRRRNVLVYEE